MFSIRVKSIYFKLILYFLFIIAVLTAAISILSNIIFSTTLEEEVANNSIQMIQQVNNNIDSYISKYTGIIDFNSKESEITEYLLLEDMNSVERIDLEYNVRSILRVMIETFPDILGILLVSENDLYLSNEMYKVKRESLTNEAWYIKAMNNPGKMQLYRSPIGRNLASSINYFTDDTVSITKAIVNPESNECIGVFLINIRMDSIKEILQSVKVGKTGFVYVIDSEDDILYAPTNEIAYRIKSEWLTDNAKHSIKKEIKSNYYQILYNKSDYTGWKTVSVSSVKETLEKVNTLRIYSTVVAIFAALLAVIMALFFSSSISKPINKLRIIMKKAEEGDFDVRFEENLKDEIGSLGHSFNSMINEIKKLLDLIYFEQKRKREAELKILQAQIKPHFLYNTLDNIQWMAMKYDADDIIEVIGAFSTLFRIGLNSGKELVCVSEELEHVKSYLLIQKVRYKEKLEYEFDIDELILNYRVIKVTLQPIVENAIYHGVKENIGSGKIIITAKEKDGMLCFSITDNGPGMQLEKSTKLNEMLSKESDNNLNKREGYGLYNVNERLRLSYGAEYGVKIKSTYGHGTTVEIYHPILEER